MNNLTVIVHTRNEERNIRRCLESCRFADELIVADMASEDHTVAIARTFTPSVLTVERVDPVDRARNAVLEKVTNPWVFVLDADEVIPLELQQEIVSIITTGERDGYFVPRRNQVFGRWLRHGYAWPDHQLRLFRRGRAHYSGKVHDPPTVDGTIGFLREPLLHFQYPTARSFVEKNRYYARLKARALREEGRRVGFLEALARPLLVFAYGYVWRLGWLDGLAGLQYAALIAHHEALWRWRLLRLTRGTHSHA